jgi:predicted RNA-binding protein YlxR (DUF448 family)
MTNPSPEPVTAVSMTAAPAQPARRLPERMCVVCRTRRPKAGLVRVYRGLDGRLEIDRTGKGPGRGAYICRTPTCWAAKGLAGRLGAALGVSLTDADRMRMAELAGALVADGATDGA